MVAGEFIPRMYHSRKSAQHIPPSHTRRMNAGMSPQPVELNNQAIASSPLRFTSESSFNAGPLGCFSPRSHLLTDPTDTFR